jgi:translation initiation factor 1
VVRLLRDRKGRGGKTVTLITGLTGSPAELQGLASDLKRLCGAGGTWRDGVLELQGDFRPRLQTELERRGYTVKIAGG